MLVGYIRVSTDDQNLSLQKDALLKYGVDERNIFSDKTSGSKDKRVGLCKNRSELDTNVGVRPDAKTEFNRTVKRS